MFRNNKSTLFSCYNKTDIGGVCVYLGKQPVLFLNKLY